jgi:hypothetical protein
MSAEVEVAKMAGIAFFFMEDKNYAESELAVQNHEHHFSLDAAIYHRGIGSRLHGLTSPS